MVLLKNKEGGGASEKTIRPRSATYVLNRRKPTEISRSISKPEVKPPIEEWKRPGEDIKVLLPKDDVVEELEEIQTPRRRLWSTHRMKGLREDLANNGSLESVIQMGTELLEGLSSADSDEIAYREEQALFWYEKAAERGSCEAKDLIQQMVNKNSTGINASNITSLREVLSLSEEELTGKRIGDLLFHSLGGNEDDHLLSGRLVEQSKVGSVESLSRSDLITSGKEFMKGRLVPEIDAKLISAEIPSSFISFLLNQYILLYYFLQNLMTEVILKNTYVYIFALGLIYRYWMFISYTFLLQGAVLVLFTSSSFILLHKPLQKKRFNAWTRLWQKSSSKSAITQKEVNLAHHNFNLAHNVRFVFAACLSIGIAEIFWGYNHPLAHYLTASLVPLLLLFRSNWTTKLVYVAIITAASMLDISVPGSFFKEDEESMEDLYLGLLIGTGVLFLTLWSKLGHELLPHLILLKILDFLYCGSQLHYVSTGLCLFISLYYCLAAFKKVTTLVIGAMIFAFFLSNKNSVPLSQLTLQKYTSVCPSHFECSKFEGLKVNWTALEVISVKQKLLRHPFNEILLSIIQFQESRLFHELDVKYCDVSLVQEWSEVMSATNDDDENAEESLFSFNFGSPSSEEERSSELQRKSIRARIWRTELCKSLTEGSVVDIIGITSSMTSDVDVTVHRN